MIIESIGYRPAYCASVDPEICSYQLLIGAYSLDITFCLNWYASRKLYTPVIQTLTVTEATICHNS